MSGCILEDPRPFLHIRLVTKYKSCYYKRLWLNECSFISQHVSGRVGLAKCVRVLYFLMNSHFDKRSYEKRVFGFPVLCKEIKHEDEKSTQTGIRRGRGGLREISRPIHRDLSVKKKKEQSMAIERRQRKEVWRERGRSEKRSTGDGFKLLVSQADKGSSAAWLSSASHTISPLFTISPLPILLHLPPWWSNSQCDVLFLYPSHSCQWYCIYHSLSYSLWVTEKKKTISQLHMPSSFTHILPRSYCISLTKSCCFPPTLGLCFLTCTLPWDLLI